MAIVAFVIWIAYGIFQWRRSSALLTKLAEIPSGQRQARATLLLVGSGAMLLAVLYGVSRVAPTEIPIWGWAVILIAGLGFVHAQTQAAALLISTAIRPK